MQRKADFGPLTEEQSARWDHALVEYDRVFRANRERDRGHPFDDLEWVKEREAIGVFHSYQPGHPKSALFRRLLDGEPALPFPPPCAYSYPWYEVVESKQPITGVQVAFEGERGSAMTLGEHMRSRPKIPGVGIVQIHQSIWTLLERADDMAIVTYGDWAASGARWRLSWIEIPASETRGFICCWHDRSKTRISTRNELWAESEFHVMKGVNDMRAVHAGEPLPHNKEDQSAHAKMMLEGRVRSAQDKIQKRLDRGWPALPDRRAIRAMIEKTFNSYLQQKDSPRPSFRVDADGRLLALQWQIERIA